MISREYIQPKALAAIALGRHSNGPTLLDGKSRGCLFLKAVSGWCQSLRRISPHPRSLRGVRKLFLAFGKRQTKWLKGLSAFHVFPMWRKAKGRLVS